MSALSTRRTAEAGIVITPIKMETITVRLRGKTGLYCHRMSAKAKRLLMIGGRKKTAAERMELKHDPRAEFHESMYFEEGVHEYTNVLFPAMAIKAAMATAALAVPGIRKTDVQRLVFFPEEWIPVYGIPRLRMDIARAADINRTPDVRTRAFFEDWGTEVTLSFSRPALSSSAIVTLLHNAGIMVGIGDNRQERGKGSYGTFYPMEGSEEFPPELLDREAQLEAILTPQPANGETADLLAEFDAEVLARA